jgi:hypothetical protein
MDRLLRTQHHKESKPRGGETKTRASLFGRDNKATIYGLPYEYLPSQNSLPLYPLRLTHIPFAHQTKHLCYLYLL